MCGEGVETAFFHGGGHSTDPSLGLPQFYAGVWPDVAAWYGRNYCCLQAARRAGRRDVTRFCACCTTIPSLPVKNEEERCRPYTTSERWTNMGLERRRWTKRYGARSAGRAGIFSAENGYLLLAYACRAAAGAYLPCAVVVFRIGLFCRCSWLLLLLPSRVPLWRAFSVLSLVLWRVSCILLPKRAWLALAFYG